MLVRNLVCIKAALELVPRTEVLSCLARTSLPSSGASHSTETTSSQNNVACLTGDIEPSESFSCEPREAWGANASSCLVYK